MTRGALPELENPHPMRLSLPALYQEDDFTTRFVSAFDTVLAPLIATLDCVDAYFDPSLAPLDLVAWLSTWVGLELDENWSDSQQRRLVAAAVELASWRGTRRGLVELLRIYAGVDEDAIEIEDSGGVGSSPTPDGPIPGAPTNNLVVTVRTNGDEVDMTRVERLVAMAKPAHVTHEVKVASR